MFKKMVYHTIIVVDVATWGIAQMCLCETKCQEGVSHLLGWVLTSMKGYRNDGIAISRDIGSRRKGSTNRALPFPPVGTHLVLMNLSRTLEHLVFSERQRTFKSLCSLSRGLLGFGEIWLVGLSKLEGISTQKGASTFCEGEEPNNERERETRKRPQGNEKDEHTRAQKENDKNRKRTEENGPVLATILKQLSSDPICLLAFKAYLVAFQTQTQNRSVLAAQLPKRSPSPLGASTSHF